MQLFSSVPAFSIRSFTPQIFNSFYFSNPIFYNLQDSKILLALLSEDFTRELGSIDDYKPACYVCWSNSNVELVSLIPLHHPQNLFRILP